MRSKIFLLIITALFLTGCQEKQYTITFNTMDGSQMKAITVDSGGTIKDINQPTKNGYLFVGWTKDGVEYDINKPITEDLTLTAKWIEKPEIYEYYNVTFVTENNTEKFTVKENETIKPLTAPEKEGYLFQGWYSGNEKFDFATKITKDISLTAKYELNVVTVTYDLDGGFGLALETIPKNSQISIPETPIKQGYKFLKWTLNGNEFSFDTKINKDITLKAVWSKIEYVDVYFDTDGGSGLTQIRIEKYTNVSKVPYPTKVGYKFQEWQLNGKTFDIETPITSSITLKAVYIEE